MTTNPTVVTYSDWLCKLYPTVSLNRIDWMSCRIDSDLWCYKTVFTNTNFRYVQNDTAKIGIEILTNVYIQPVIAVESRFNVNAISCRTQQGFDYLYSFIWATYTCLI